MADRDAAPATAEGADARHWSEDAAFAAWLAAWEREHPRGAYGVASMHAAWRAARPAPPAAPREGDIRISLDAEQLEAFEATVRKVRAEGEGHDTWAAGQAALGVFDFIDPDELIAMVRAAAREAARGEGVAR